MRPISTTVLIQTSAIIALAFLPFIASYAANNDPIAPQEWGTMMTALLGNLPNVVRLIVAIAYVMGAWMIYSGLYTLKIYGDARTMMPSHASFGGPIFRIMIGVMLLLMPRFVIISINSLWGTGASILQYYTLPPKLAQWQPAMNGVIAVIRVFGYISFVRGFMLMSKATKQNAQPGLYGKGIMHVVGGLLSINIVGTINIIRHSFGLT